MFYNPCSRWDDYEDSHSCYGIGAGLGSLLGGIFSGGLGAIGSTTAANQQAAAQQNALNFQTGVYNTAQSQLAPYLAGGTNAYNSLAAGVGFANAPGILGTSPENFGAQTGRPVPEAPTYNMPNFNLSQFQSSPGYQFQLQQGLNAINNSGNALTGTLSGNTLRGLQTYGTGLANQDWWNWLNNQQNNYNTGYQAQTQEATTGYQEAAQNQQTLYNRLLQLALGGQSASTVGLQSNLPQTIGNTASSIGATQAAGTLGAFGGANTALNSLTNPSSGFAALLANTTSQGNVANNTPYAYLLNSAPTQGSATDYGYNTGGY